MMQDNGAMEYTLAKLENRHDVDLYAAGLDIERRLSTDLQGNPVEVSLINQAVTAMVDFIGSMIELFAVFNVWDANGMSAFYFYAFTNNDLVLKEY